MLNNYLSQKQNHKAKAEIARNAKEEAKVAKKEASRLRVEAIKQALKSSKLKHSAFVLDYRVLRCSSRYSSCADAITDSLIESQITEGLELEKLIERLTERKEKILSNLSSLNDDELKRLINLGCVSLNIEKALKIGGLV